MMPLTKEEGKEFEKKMLGWEKPGLKLSTAFPSLLFAFK
jgi:hypothetical protein